MKANLLKLNIPTHKETEILLRFFIKVFFQKLISSFVSELKTKFIQGKKCHHYY